MCDMESSGFSVSRCWLVWDVNLAFDARQVRQVEFAKIATQNGFVRLLRPRLGLHHFRLISTTHLRAAQHGPVGNRSSVLFGRKLIDGEIATLFSSPF